MSGLDYIIRVSPDVIFQEVLLGESLLMDTRSLTYFALDELGTRVWQEIREGGEVAPAFRCLVAATGLPEDDLLLKFNSIIKGLERSRIIQLEHKTDTFSDP